MSNVSLGQAHEVEVTLGKAGATGENFWDPIAKSEALAMKVVAMVVEEMKPVFTLSTTTDRDMTGWKCVEPVEVEAGEFEFGLLDFLQGKSYLGGEDMVKFGKEKGANSSLKHIEAVIRGQDRIPVELRQFCLVSTEVWLSPHGLRYVWYAYWADNRWVLNFHYLDLDFNSYYRLLVPRKYQKQA